MDISTEVAAIQVASHGSELRQPLVDALNILNSGSLPAVTASDVGKILKVGANGWEVGEKSGYMPVPTDTMQITDNGTYDVTNYASANVHISGGGSAVLVSKTITQNGTYDPADDNADGYSEVIVNVSGSFVIYNNDRTLAAYLDQINNRIVWYFIGFEKTASDVPVPPEMILTQSGLMYSKAYDSDKETQIGQIGFYNGNIRSWSINTAQTIAGKFWGVVYSDSGTDQVNPYTDPPQ